MWGVSNNIMVSPGGFVRSDVSDLFMQIFWKDFRLRGKFWVDLYLLTFSNLSRIFSVILLWKKCKRGASLAVSCFRKQIVFRIRTDSMFWYWKIDNIRPSNWIHMKFSREGKSWRCLESWTLFFFIQIGLRRSINSQLRSYSHNMGIQHLKYCSIKWVTSLHNFRLFTDFTSGIFSLLLKSTLSNISPKCHRKFYLFQPA